MKPPPTLKRHSPIHLHHHLGEGQVTLPSQGSGDRGSALSVPRGRQHGRMGFLL